MNFRCSKAVVALALLIGSVGCALFAPAARAGDRIEFSAPAIPLTVPQPDVEIKEPNKMITTADVADGVMGGADMAPLPENVIIARHKTREQDPWGSNPLRNDDPYQRDAGDWLTARPESGHLTNGGSLNMQRGWDSSPSGSLLRRREDSGLETGQNASRFDALNGFDKDNAREKARFEQGSFSEKEASFWTKAFNHDLSAPNPVNVFRFVPSMKEFGAGGAYEERISNPARAADSARAPALPPGNASYTPMDENQSRQIGEQAGGGQEYLRAWEPPPSRPPTSRTYSDPDQIRASRVAAPSKPVRLPMPKRPGDPF